MAIIRSGILRDLPGAYYVCALTSGAGQSLPEGSEPWANPELLGHVYVGPYFSSFIDSGEATSSATVPIIVHDQLGVAGYCLGAADTNRFHHWCEQHWWPRLRDDYPKDEDRTVNESAIVDIIHAPPTTPPDIVAAFPAHLHIDLLDRIRGQGFGRTLIGQMMRELARNGAHGVHLEVGEGNTNAISFYSHLGFSEAARSSHGVVMVRAIEVD